MRMGKKGIFGEVKRLGKGKKKCREVYRGKKVNIYGKGKKEPRNRKKI